LKEFPLHNLYGMAENFLHSGDAEPHVKKYRSSCSYESSYSRQLRFTPSHHGDQPKPHRYAIEHNQKIECGNAKQNLAW